MKEWIGWIGSGNVRTNSFLEGQNQRNRLVPPKTVIAALVRPRSLVFPLTLPLGAATGNCGCGATILQTSNNIRETSSTSFSYSPSVSCNPRVWLSIVRTDLCKVLVVGRTERSECGTPSTTRIRNLRHQWGELSNLKLWQSTGHLKNSQTQTEAEKFLNLI